MEKELARTQEAQAPDANDKDVECWWQSIGAGSVIL